MGFGVLNYLLSPEFQIVNTAGKPCTGYLEVYISGSRERYYCASDFDGTLYPFQVPLDSLGSNVVLADDAHAYDVYIYNRYGSLLMSRYNVHPGAGGGSIGTGDITSSDGSIIVTQTANGVDLRTNSTPPSILRATAQDLYADGQFVFSEVERDGQNAVVDNSGRIIVNEGWWHYDATVRLRWTGPAQNETQSVSLYTQNASDSMTFDLSYTHTETVQVSGEYKARNDSTQFVLGVTNVPSGMVVDLVDFGVHSIVGDGAGGNYEGGTGIVIDETNRVISIDTDVVQERLTAGNNITIEDNVISATAEPQVQADWAQSDSEAVDYIKNKPDLSVYATQTDLTNGLATKQDVISDLATIRAGAALGATAVQDPNYVHTDNNYTNADAAKLSGIEAGAEVNVQANWAETDSSSDAYIQNKPVNLVQDANYVHTDNNFTTTEKNKLAGISAGAEVNVQSDWTESDSSSDAYILNKPTLATVATSGSYTDLSNTPSIPTATSDLTNDSGYITLSDVPAQVQADWTETDTNAASYIQHKPTIPSTLSAGDGIDITNNVVSAKVDGSTVTVNASGELQASPAVTVDQTYDPTSTNPQSGTAVADALATIDTTDLFVATYNVTTFADVLAAYNAGKTILCKKPDVTDNDMYLACTDVGTYNQQILKFNFSSVAGSPNHNYVSVVEAFLSYYTGWSDNDTVLEPLQSNWNETDSTSLAYIQNKPTIPAAQVNSDWSANSGVAQILNKPTVKSVLAGSNITITETANDFTIAASVPVIGTITV